MTMNNYKVIYMENNIEQFCIVAAQTKQMAYNKFRKLYGPLPKVKNIVNMSVESKKKVAKENMITRIAIMLVVTFFVGFILGVFITSSVPHPVSVKPYVVSSGDSLWSIAEMSDGWEHIDTRIIVDHIQSFSNCSSLIHTGDVIYIPMYYN